MIPDKSGEKAREFVGEEEPQFIPDEENGTRFVLTAEELGSLVEGTPVLLRGIEVGEVLDTELDANADGVSIPVFIRKPFDALVKRQTRFWDSSGIALDLNAEGFSVRAQSVRSVLAGGINFYTPPTNENDEMATADTVFRLHESL